MLGDLELIQLLTVHIPTSTRLHATRERWDQCIRKELATTNAEAVELRTLSTQAPIRSRVWRLLREEAIKLERHVACTQMWLTNRNDPFNPRHPDELLL